MKNPTNRGMYALIHQVLEATSSEEVNDRTGLRGRIGLNTQMLTRYGTLIVK